MYQVVYSGFDLIVNLDEINSNCDIINCVKENLKTFFKNMPVLLNKIDEESIEYHIHDVKFGTILVSSPDEIYYVCTHCDFWDR